MEATMRTGAAETKKGEWSGSLTNVDNGDVVWWCEHQHPDDIEAEFCALDQLQAIQATQSEFDYADEGWNDLGELVGELEDELEELESGEIDLENLDEDEDEDEDSG